MARIFAEWICKKCGELHRVSFNLQIDTHTRVGSYFFKDGVTIVDRVYQLKQGEKTRHQYKEPTIYATSDIPIPTLINTLKEYMHLYYTLVEDTLKVEVCL